MKKLGILYILFGFFLASDACPCFDCVDETKPTTARVLYKKIWIYKNISIQKGWARIAPRKYFNSVSFRFPKGTLNEATFAIQLNHRYFLPDDEWGMAHVRSERKVLTADEHLDSNSYDQTDLYYANNDCRSFILEQLSGNIPDSFQVEVIFLYVPPLPKSLARPIASRSSCDSPSFIPQSFWREGLPNPIKGRTSTATHHCVVHHSADGNGDTAYTELVRAYYTFHTQVNGWDDIGYNYLIAANGDIYAGRDPEKPEIRQDNVLGAHFCSKNNNTMGVCMIGNFMTEKPSEVAMSSLFQLLGWKLKKDNLNPFSTLLHPDGNGNALGVIAGHRDGCNTSCPGDKVYALLDSVRVEAGKCTPFSTIQKTKETEPTIVQMGNQWAFKNIPTGTQLRVFDALGRLVFMQVIQSETMEMPLVMLGNNCYFMVLDLGDGRKLTKQILL